MAHTKAWFRYAKKDKDKASDNAQKGSSALVPSNITAQNSVAWRQLRDEDDEGDSGQGGVGELTPAESARKEGQRRRLEQKGHSQYAHVNARYRPEYTNQAAPAYGFQLEQHPLLAELQRFDGIDKNLSADPSMAPDDVKRELENELREQELKKQARLEHTLANQNQARPSFNPRPSPR